MSFKKYRVIGKKNLSKNNQKWGNPQKKKGTTIPDQMQGGQPLQKKTKMETREQNNVTLSKKESQ